jgi:hypothetical protein
MNTERPCGARRSPELHPLMSARKKVHSLAYPKTILINGNGMNGVVSESLDIYSVYAIII